MPAVRLKTPLHSPHPSAETGVEACILAGGLSSRMGRDKSQVRLGSRSLLAWCREVPRQLGLLTRVIRRDAVRRCGPLGGVLTAFRRSSAPALLFLACDTPFLAPSLAGRILRLWQSRRKPVFTLQDGLVGFPFLLPRSAAPLVAQQVAAGMLSLQHLALALAAVHTRPTARERSGSININAPADLARARRQARSSSRSPAVRPSMRAKVSLALLILATCLPAQSQTSPAPLLLPPETQAFVSIPSAAASRAAWLRSPGHKAWADPAFAHVRKTGTARFDLSIAEWVRQSTGFDPGEVLGYAEGQVTLAWIGSRAPDPSATNQSGWIFLLDAGANAPRLRSLWHAIANSLPSTRPKVFTTNYAETEFLVVPPQPEAPGAPPTAPSETADPTPNPAAPAILPADGTWVGIADQLLLAASGPGPIRAVLERHRSPTLATLATTAAFRLVNPSPPQTYPTCHGWVNLQELVRQYLLRVSSPSKGPTQGHVLQPSLPRVFQAAGISALRSLSFQADALPTGLVFHAQLALPEAERKGLFDSFRLTGGSTAPPAFVPANATRFQRWRLDGARAWAGIERLLSELSPPLSGVLDLSLNALGKDRDASFDFRKSFVQALGNDWIYLESPAPTHTPTSTPPSRLLLIGSTRPDDLQKGIVVAASLLPAADARDRIRETVVAGHTIKSLPLESLGPEAAGLELHFTTHGDYVAFTSSLAALTNILHRANPTNGPTSSLDSTNVFAHQLGSFDGGVFAYENLAATWTALAEVVRHPDPESWTYLLPGGLMRRLTTLLGPDTLPAQAIARHLPVSAIRTRATDQGYEATLVLPAGFPLQSPP